MKNSCVSISSLDMVLSNEYLDKYIKLMVDNEHTQSVVGRTQCHHIIPRWYYQYTNTPIDDSEGNIIHLLYKDHILAHYFLAQCTTGLLHKAMLSAFMMISNFSNDFDPTRLENYQKLYEESIQIRKGISPPNKGKPMSEEQKRKISNTLKGHAVSEESRMRMRLAQLNMSPDKRAKITAASKCRKYVPTAETRHKQSCSLMGHIVTEETRRKIGEGNRKQRGNRWYTDGKTCVLVHPDETPPEGFVIGTLRGGKSWYNNGKIQTTSFTCPEGFVKGRLRHD